MKLTAFGYDKQKYLDSHKNIKILRDYSINNKDMGIDYICEKCFIVIFYYLIDITNNGAIFVWGANDPYDTLTCDQIVMKNVLE